MRTFIITSSDRHSLESRGDPSPSFALKMTNINLNNEYLSITSIFKTTEDIKHSYSSRDNHTMFKTHGVIDKVEILALQRQS